jgi:ankyrin repeat protein
MASFGLGRAADPQQQSPAEGIDSSTPWMAASEGNLTLLQSSLASLQLPFTAADENGYTLLHAAASYNHLELMQFLLQNHVDVNAVDNDGDSALHYAGNVPSAKLLVEVGRVNPLLPNGQGKTALQAKQEELNEMMADEDIEDDDEDVETLTSVVGYLSSLR